MIIKVRPDDIIVVKTDPAWDQPDTLEIAKENVAAMIKAVDGKKRAILSHTADNYLSKDVLKYYSEAHSSVGAVATAVIASSFGSKIMGNLFLKILKREAPTQIFTEKEEDKAIEWLLECIKNAKN
jgi:hypothetical protein